MPYEEDAPPIADLTPRMQRKAHLEVRFYRGMYVMHMERFREMQREFWEATRRGERQRAAWLLEDAQAIAKEAQRLLRRQHTTEKRLLMLGGPPPAPPPPANIVPFRTPGGGRRIVTPDYMPF